MFTSAPAGRWRCVWKLGSDSRDQPHSHVYFSQIGQEQSSLLVPLMRGSGLYEWMHKSVTEGVVNHPNLGINFVTCFVRLLMNKYTPSWKTCQLSDDTKRARVGYCLRKLKMFLCRKASRPINRPWLVAGLISKAPYGIMVSKTTHTDIRWTLSTYSEHVC